MLGPIRAYSIYLSFVYNRARLKNATPAGTRYYSANLFVIQLKYCLSMLARRLVVNFFFFNLLSLL